MPGKSNPNLAGDLAHELYHISRDADCISRLCGGSFQQAYQAADVQAAIADLIEAAKGGDEGQLQGHFARVVYQLKELENLTEGKIRARLENHATDPSLSRILRYAQHIRQDIRQTGYNDHTISGDATP
jgi:hypothetical protein